jgi:PAS domain-containing protein
MDLAGPGSLLDDDITLLLADDIQVEEKKESASAEPQHHAERWVVDMLTGQTIVVENKLAKDFLGKPLRDKKVQDLYKLLTQESAYKLKERLDKFEGATRVLLNLGNTELTHQEVADKLVTLGIITELKDDGPQLFLVFQAEHQAAQAAHALDRNARYNPATPDGTVSAYWIARLEHITTDTLDKAALEHAQAWRMPSPIVLELQQDGPDKTSDDWNPCGKSSRRGRHVVAVTQPCAGIDEPTSWDINEVVIDADHKMFLKLNQDGEIKDANGMAQAILGACLPDLMGRHLVFYSPTAPIDDYLAIAKLYGKSDMPDMPISGKNGVKLHGKVEFKYHSDAGTPYYEATIDTRERSPWEDVVTGPFFHLDTYGTILYMNTEATDMLNDSATGTQIMEYFPNRTKDLTRCLQVLQRDKIRLRDFSGIMAELTSEDEKQSSYSGRRQWHGDVEAAYSEEDLVFLTISGPRLLVSDISVLVDPDLLRLELFWDTYDEYKGEVTTGNGFELPGKLLGVTVKGNSKQGYELDMCDTSESKTERKSGNAVKTDRNKIASLAAALHALKLDGSQAENLMHINEAVGTAKRLFEHMQFKEDADAMYVEKLYKKLYLNYIDHKRRNMLESQPTGILVDGTHRMIIIADEKMQVTHTNHMARLQLSPLNMDDGEWLGAPAMLDINIRDFVMDDHSSDGGRLLFEKGIRAVQNGESRRLGKCTLKAPDWSSSVVCNVVVSPHFDKFGDVAGIIVEALDIADRLFQNAIVECILPSSGIIEDGPLEEQLIIKLDKKFDIVNATPHALDLFHWNEKFNIPNEMALGSGFVGLLDPKSFDAINQCLKRSLEHGEETLCRVIPAHAPTEKLNLKVSPSFDADGEIDGILITVDTPAAFELDEEGIVLTCNDEAGSLLGVEKYALIGHKLIDFVEGKYKMDTYDALLHVLQPTTTDEKTFDMNVVNRGGKYRAAPHGCRMHLSRNDRDGKKRVMAVVQKNKYKKENMNPGSNKYDWTEHQLEQTGNIGGTNAEMHLFKVESVSLKGIENTKFEDLKDWQQTWVRMVDKDTEKVNFDHFKKYLIEVEGSKRPLNHAGSGLNKIHMFKPKLIENGFKNLQGGIHNGKEWGVSDPAERTLEAEIEMAQFKLWWDTTEAYINKDDRGGVVGSYL